MANRYYETFLVTGVVNSEVISKSFIAPENEHRYVEGVYLNVSARAGNTIDLYLEREKIAELTDYMLALPGEDTETFWPLNLDLPVGLSLTVSVVSGGTASNLRAIYRYTVG